MVKLQDSEATKNAKDERAKVRPCPPIPYSRPDPIGLSLQLTSSIKEDPKLRAAVEELWKAGVQVGDAVSEAFKSMEESEVMRAVRTSERLSSISSLQPYNMRVDLTCYLSRVFNDREDDRTHPKHGRLQDPCRDHC